MKGEDGNSRGVYKRNYPPQFLPPVYHVLSVFHEVWVAVRPVGEARRPTSVLEDKLGYKLD